MSNKITVTTIVKRGEEELTRWNYDVAEQPPIVIPPPVEKTILVRLLTAINLRAEPSPTAAKLRAEPFPIGTQLSIVDATYVHNGGYAWAQLADKSGFIAVGPSKDDMITDNWVEVVVPEEPTYPPASGRNVKSVKQSDDVVIVSPTSQKDGRSRVGASIRSLFNMDHMPQHIIPPGNRDYAIESVIDAAKRFALGVLRVYAAAGDLSPEQCAENAVYTLNHFKSLYNAELDAYPVQFMITLADSMSAAGAHIGGLAPFHTGPNGHLNYMFYRSATAKAVYFDWIERYLRALKNKGVDDLIVGFEVLNEPQLEPNTRSTTNADAMMGFIHEAAYRIKTLWLDKAVSAGFASTWAGTASESGESQEIRSQKYYKNNVLDIVSIHAYTLGRNQEGYPVNGVAQVLYEEDKLKIDADTAKSLGLALFAGEYSSLNTTFGEYGWDTPRNAVDAHQYDKFDAWGAWAICYWALQTTTYNIGIGDWIGGADYIADPTAMPGVMDTLYNRAVKYWVRGQ